MSLFFDGQTSHNSKVKFGDNSKYDLMTSNSFKIINSLLDEHEDELFTILNERIPRYGYNYSVSKSIEKTLYGKVCLLSNKNNHHMILKISHRYFLDTHTSRFSKKKVSDDSRREVDIMKFIQDSAKDNYCLHLIDSFEDEMFHYILYPYISGGDLINFYISLKSHGNINPSENSIDNCPDQKISSRSVDERKLESKVLDRRGKKKYSGQFIYDMKGFVYNYRKWFCQLVHAINYLHKIKGISHNDLSLENICLTEDGDIKIIDFGSAMIHPLVKNERYEQALIYIGKDNSIEKFKCRHKSGTSIGKNGFKSPEITHGAEFDAYANDLWSLGFILFCMVFREFPFKISDIYNNYWCRQIVFNPVKIKSVNNDDHLAVDLINKLLKLEDKRINLDEVLEHEFVKGYDIKEFSSSFCVGDQSSNFKKNSSKKFKKMKYSRTD